MRSSVDPYGLDLTSNVADLARRRLPQFGFEPEVELEAEAPEGSGPIVELTVIRAGGR